jgi:phosphatidylglycerol:prolipoprotein diacylglycerol transferase
LPSLFHPELHPVFETLAYMGGYAVYRRMRAQQGDALSDERRWLIIATTAVGALIGSRILGLLEQAPHDGWDWRQLIMPGGGKTIVGGLLGGWFAVEIVKCCIGIRSRTGDLFAVPLCVGIAIGRIGCFLAILGVILWKWNARPHVNGRIFRVFMAAYLGWRLLIDFIKPQPLVDGMNVIQWACVAGLLVLAIGEGMKKESQYV